MSEADFDERFGATAIERTGAVGLRRNAEIVERNASVAGPCPAV
jgi:hypothetical protein